MTHVFEQPISHGTEAGALKQDAKVAADVTGLLLLTHTTGALEVRLELGHRTAIHRGHRFADLDLFGAGGEGEQEAVLPVIIVGRFAVAGDEQRVSEEI